MSKLTLGLAALAVSAAALPATAQRYDGYGYGENHDRAYREAYRDGYNRPLRYAYRDPGYGYGNQRAYRRCSNGTTGTIIGAIAGGLLGRAIDDRGDHATGTIVGGVGGALAGRAIERSGDGYCYR
jgi:hypothetical protein